MLLVQGLYLAQNYDGRALVEVFKYYQRKSVVYVISAQLFIHSIWIFNRCIILVPLGDHKKNHNTMDIFKHFTYFCVRTEMGHMTYSCVNIFRVWILTSSCFLEYYFSPCLHLRITECLGVF